MLKPVPLINLPTESELDRLAGKLSKLRAEQSLMRNEECEIELRVAAIIGSKREGSTSIETDRFKVTTTGSVERILDVDRVHDIESNSLLPEMLCHRAFRREIVLDEAQVRFMQLNEPDSYAVLKTAFTTEPRRVRVTVLPVE